MWLIPHPPIRVSPNKDTPYQTYVLTQNAFSASNEEVTGEGLIYM